jgi:hypothetical protein
MSNFLIISDMRFISLWAGNTGSDLPSHLTKLYTSIGHSGFQRDPEVCAEPERVPIEELLEPFSLPEKYHVEAVAAAERESLHLATTVVAVYTDNPPGSESVQPSGCALRFIGTFPC